MTALRHSFAAGDALYAQDLQENVDDTVQALDNLTGSNLTADAGITSRQIASRFAVERVVIPLIPAWVDGTDWGGAAVAPAGRAGTLNATPQRIHWHRERVRAGQQVFLCRVELSVLESTVGGTDWPTVRILVDGNNIAAGDIEIDPTGGDDDTFFFSVGLPDYIADPLMALQDGSTVEFLLGKTGAGTPTLRGLTAILVLKRELVE